MFCKLLSINEKYEHYISRCKHRTEEIPEEIFEEVHHIKVRALGGLDIPENRVVLYPAEHLIAHWLLATETKDEMLVQTVNRMTHRLVFGVDYTVDEINIAAEIHGKAKQKQYEEFSRPIYLVLRRDYSVVKYYKSMADCKEHVKEDSGGFTFGSIMKGSSCFCLVSKDKYNNKKNKPIYSICVRHTPFTDITLHQSFKNAEEVALCLGLTEDEVLEKIKNIEPFEENNNTWTFKFKEKKHGKRGAATDEATNVS